VTPSPGSASDRKRSIAHGAIKVVNLSAVDDLLFNQASKSTCPLSLSRLISARGTFLTSPLRRMSASRHKRSFNNRSLGE
jgi:hypothetical protein